MRLILVHAALAASSQAFQLLPQLHGLRLVSVSSFRNTQPCTMTENDDEEDEMAVKTRVAELREDFSVFLKYHYQDTQMVAGAWGVNVDRPDFPMFRQVDKTGVIFATSLAQQHGFVSFEDPEWANMGQGAPETGPIEGAPPRSFDLHIPDPQVEYAPTTGIKELRQKIADYYNHLYRQGKESQYTAANVCVVPGGRAGITRIMSILGNTQVGFFNPDYTAYEQALGLFIRITPSMFLHKDVNEAIMTPADFAFEVKGRGLGSVLLSNPSNPTGQSIEGEDLNEYVRIAREENIAICMDEFYSHYYYDGDAVDPIDGGADDDSNWPKTVSSASYIEDVNKDPILIVNGLTKNWRCPGFRCCWVVAPSPIVEMLGSAGSYLDGGCNAPLQRLALPLMDLDFTRKDAWALQRHFKMKRDFLLEHLDSLGITVKFKPTATFYVWADLSDLPLPLTDCFCFLEECVKHKIIIVPGVFFDINPRGVRNVMKSSCLSNVRFSYGPPMQNLIVGMKQLGIMIEKWRKNPMSVESYLLEVIKREKDDLEKMRQQETPEVGAD